MENQYYMYRQLELEPLVQIMMILESVMFSLSPYEFSLQSGLVHWCVLHCIIKPIFGNRYGPGVIP